MAHFEAIKRREGEKGGETGEEIRLAVESTVMLNLTPLAKMVGRGSIPCSRPEWGYSKGTPEGILEDVPCW